jgi:hypothetical protein
MPRANRHFLPGYIWHITHRCHHKNLLLKFARDRRSYLRWLFEAKKRFGLSRKSMTTAGIDESLSRFRGQLYRAQAREC